MDIIQNNNNQNIENIQYKVITKNNLALRALYNRFFSTHINQGSNFPSGKIDPALLIFITHLYDTDIKYEYELNNAQLEESVYNNVIIDEI